MEYLGQKFAETDRDGHRGEGERKRRLGCGPQPREGLDHSLCVLLADD